MRDAKDLVDGVKWVPPIRMIVTLNQTLSLTLSQNRRAELRDLPRPAAFNCVLPEERLHTDKHTSNLSAGMPQWLLKLDRQLWKSLKITHNPGTGSWCKSLTPAFTKSACCFSFTLMQPVFFFFFCKEWNISWFHCSPLSLFLYIEAWLLLCSPVCSSSSSCAIWQGSWCGWWLSWWYWS